MKRTAFLLTTVLVTGLLTPHFTFGQQLADENIFVDAQGREYKVGDDLVIGVPAGPSGEFKFIRSTSQKKFDFVNKVAGKVSDAGKSVAKAGADFGSGDAYTTGLDAAGKANSASEVSRAGEQLLSGDHDLTGQSLRILRFNVTGNERRGEHFYATVAGPGRGNYEIEIIPALNTGELAGLNGKLFEKEQSE